MSWENLNDYRWRLRAPTSVPTIAVIDLAADDQAERELKIKAGARVVPFGFARAIPQPPPPDPLLWEGED